MNGHERIIASLQRRQPDRVPTFEWFIDKKVTLTLAATEDILEAVEVLDIDGVNARADYARRFTTNTDYIDEWGTTHRGGSPHWRRRCADSRERVRSFSTCVTGSPT